MALPPKPFSGWWPAAGVTNFSCMPRIDLVMHPSCPRTLAAPGKGVPSVNPFPESSKNQRVIGHGLGGAPCNLLGRSGGANSQGVPVMVETARR